MRGHVCELLVSGHGCHCVSKQPSMQPLQSFFTLPEVLSPAIHALPFTPIPCCTNAPLVLRPHTPPIMHLLSRQVLGELHAVLQRCPLMAGTDDSSLASGTAVLRAVPPSAQRQAGVLLQMYCAALPAVRLPW